MRLVVLAVSLVLLVGCTITRPLDVTPGPETDPGTTSEFSCIPGEELVLDAPDTHYIVSGDCAAVSVEGNALEVELETVGDLTVTGNDNVIEALSVGTLQITGADNTVTSGTEIGHISVSGDGNDVKRS